jgi:hypothetical protein
MEKVTVIINNRDLLEWPRKMCEKISTLKEVDEIIILDNASTNRELFQWYKSCPYKVLFLDNIGHKAPWTSGILKYIANDYYVVTDPDLDIDDLPVDTLSKMIKVLQNKPDLGKVGLSLRTDDVPSNSPYYLHVNTYEKNMQSKLSEDGDYYEAPVDTTFALYDKRILNSYEVSGVRLPRPYEAKHNPWYLIDGHNNVEFIEYLKKADSKFSSYKNFLPNTENISLESLYQSKKGKVSTKWKSYFEVYERILGKLKNNSISLLEIGVQNGGSLEIWADYFKNAKILVGCDINPKVLDLKFNDNRIKVIGESASNSSAISKINNLSVEGYDVIIDDGSHRSADSIMNFISYFDLLKPGGTFIIEDMHCAYWPEYGGGYFNELSISNFMKKLLDLLNIEHCRGDFDAEKLFQTYFINGNCPNFIKNQQIYSISIYNSIYVIEKSTSINKPLLGNCVIVGDEALVDNRVLIK